jgi:hypothetical protein
LETNDPATAKTSSSKRLRHAESRKNIEAEISLGTP